MVLLVPIPVDAPVARRMLTEYFDSRIAGFAEQGTVYTPTFPDRAAFTEPAGVFLLAQDGDDPIGCGGIRSVADGATGRRYEVKHLFVSPRARGKGAGSALLDGLEQRARAWGAAELVLDTHHSLLPAAALYARAGFEPTEPYNDNPNATVWLSKLL